MATENSPESIFTSATFVAYELVSAAGFLVFFTPYALFKMIRTPAFRAGIGQRLSLYGATPQQAPDSHPVWIQAASVGEVKSVTPLVRMINESGGLPVFLTSTTETGFRVAEELAGKDNEAGYFPLDFSPIVFRTLKRVRPRAIVLFETEIWPNFIRAASSLGIPISIVNGRISEKSFRYYRLAPTIFRSALSKISFIGVQSSRDAERAIALGARPDAVKIYGNVKFDAAPPPPLPDEVEQMRAVLKLKGNSPLIVAGSTHEGEETVLIEVYKRLLQKVPGLRLLIAPRHSERFGAVETLIRDAGFAVHKRSDFAGSQSSASDAVILLDTIGELSRVYALASISFVGGSLVKIGGHNIIEPASLGKPVIFGPHMQNFDDIKEAFISQKAGITVEDAGGLFEETLRLLKEPSITRAIGEAAKRVVEANRGATARYFEGIKIYF